MINGRMEWGVIVNTTRTVEPGMTVTAKRRDGHTQDVVIDRVLSHRGKEAYCTIRPVEQKSEQVIRYAGTVDVAQMQQAAKQWRNSSAARRFAERSGEGQDSYERKYQIGL